MANITIENQVLSAGSDGNDTFIFPKGSTGDATANTMMGGLGDDYYEIDSIDSAVVENGNSGTDTVCYMAGLAGQQFSLAANVEIALIDREASNVTVYGNSGNNVITVSNSAATLNVSLYGGEGNDTLSADAGSNEIDGGTGADTMRGYDGDDIYRVDNLGDKVIESASSAGGYDKVYSTVSYTLSQNVEELILEGSAKVGVGNDGANTLWDNDGDNTLIGGSGNDVLYAGNGNDRLDGGSGDDYLEDNRGNNQLFGGLGNDTLMSGSGNDLLDGGAGNDTLDAGNGDNIIFGGAGNDRIIGGWEDDVLDGGSGDDVILDAGGDDRSNTLRGGDGSDLIIAEADGGYCSGNTLDGGNGNDILVDNSMNMFSEGRDGIWRSEVLRGGAGDDHYYLRITSDLDKVQLVDTSGIDTVYLGGWVERDPEIPTGDVEFALGDAQADYAHFTLASGIENVDASRAGVSAYLVGNGGNNLMIGSGASDVLIGGAGNDTLNGLEGADNLIGGNGNDVYLIDDADDTVVEESSGGIDTVYSSVSHKLEGQVEHLRLVGTADLTASGNNLNNTIEGNGGRNLIAGGDGNDVLSGGNDNVADTLWGGSGNDILYGQSGDVLYGGLGDDIYYVSGNAAVYEGADEGKDSVIATGNYTLGAHLDNLTLAAGAGNWTAVGNDLDNYIKGNDGNNTLIGGGGSDQDVLEGGKGNDHYFITWNGAARTDRVIEQAGGGDDTVHLVVENFAIGTHSIVLGTGDFNQIEHLNLSGPSYVDHVGDPAFSITGSSLANTIVGSSIQDYINGGAGNDVIDGDSGNDLLFGGLGDDTLIGGFGLNTLDGGAGNDVYILGGGLDFISDIGGGSDTVIGQDMDVNLFQYQGVENMIGRAVTNNVTLSGTDGVANTLSGSASAGHYLEINGGTGNDTYIIEAGSNANRVLVVEGGTNSATDFDTVISNILRYTLTANVERLILSGTAYYGEGNTLNNTLIGNSDNNQLNGRGGDDYMEGGDGSDIYFVDSTKDVIIEGVGKGIDQIRYGAAGTYTLAANVEAGEVRSDLPGLTGVNIIGNALNNQLYGNESSNSLSGGAGNDEIAGKGGNDYLDGGAGNDYLDGGTGNDILIGEQGNDIYIIDSSSDIITESLGGGIDSVYMDSSATDASYTLAAFVENLSAVGTTIAVTLVGNDLGNSLIGNNLDNTLDGGKGNDYLAGGGGNDTYLIDSNADFVVDTGNSNGDHILAKSTSFNLATNGIGVEKLTLDNGTLSVVAIGNQLANTITVLGNGDAYVEGGGGDDNLTGGSGVDTLIGGIGNDTLDGGGGVDTLVGGQGNDTYKINSASEAIRELENEGIDTVNCSASGYTLGANLENLNLTDGALSGSGNSLNNLLTGNSLNNTLLGGAGHDTLIGGSGSDTLTGGADNDVFVFAEHGNADADRITDFTVGQDHLQLKSSVFTLLDANNDHILDAGTFNGVYDGNTWGSGHVAYNAVTGELWYSLDGSGSDKSLVAILGDGGHPALTNTDILVV